MDETYQPAPCEPQPSAPHVATPEPKGIKMDGQHDKVDVQNIFKPGHSDGGGNAPWAAILPALMANKHDIGYGGFGGGLGAGVVGGLLVNLLRRGVGDGDGCREPVGGVSPAQAAFDQSLLNGITGLTAAVPTTALQTQAATQQAIGALALGTQQGFGNVKDTVQAAAGTNLAAIGGVKDSVQLLATGLASAICGVNQNVSAQGCMTREAVQNDGDKTRALLVSRFQLEDSTRINELNARVIELQSEGRRHADVADLRQTITVNNTAVAAQQQGQVQAQQQQQQQAIIELGRAVSMLVGDIQAVRQGQVIFNSGTMAASGTQAAANTKVN